MEDDKIIALLWTRDENAISELMSKYGQKLMRFANGILKNSEDAKEIVNDTFLKVWNLIPPKRPDYLYAFMAKICRFEAFGRIDWNQAEKRNAQIVELTAEMEECIADTSNLYTYEDKEVGRYISEFLRGLPKEDRVLFVRRYWYTDSVRELASRYGLSESNVKVRLHRVRKKLRDYLKEMI